jgi:hypothetical protein
MMLNLTGTRYSFWLFWSTTTTKPFSPKQVGVGYFLLFWAYAKKACIYKDLHYASTTENLRPSICQDSQQQPSSSQGKK